MIYLFFVSPGGGTTGLPLFSLTLFVFLPDVTDHKRGIPQGQQSQWTPFLPIQIPSLQGIGSGRAFRCSSLRGTFTAPSLEVTKSTCRVQGLSPRVCPCLTLQDQEPPKAPVPEQEDAEEAGGCWGSRESLWSSFCSEESLLLCVFIAGHCFGSWV